jgi:hypothetical protein
VLAATEADARSVEQQVSGPATRSGIEYVGTVSLAAVPDARAAVQQLVGRGAHGLVLPGDLAAAGQVAHAIRDLGLGEQVTAFGFDELADQAYPDQAGDAATGGVVVAPIAAALTDTPRAAWPPAYRAFVTAAAARYGYTANGVDVRALPAAAECVGLWARAVRRAGSFDGQQVARAWEGLQVEADQTVLGVPERFTPQQHDALASDGLFVYQWVRKGGRFRLTQLAP